jgi:hypothetical protein
MDKHQAVPLWFAAVTVCLLMGGVLVVQIFVQRDIYFVDRFYAGLDYNDFHRASVLLAQGRSPYEIDRYVTPPVPAALNLPLSLLPFGFARYVVMLAVLFSVPCSYWLLDRLFNPCNGQGNRMWGYLMMTGVSYPFIFLVDRGNIDGFVLLIVALGLFLGQKRSAAAGLLFGLAISMKIYPVLLVIPMIAFRRWRMLVFTMLGLIGLIIVLPHEWYAFVTERLLVRGSDWRADENASLANTFYYVGRAVDYTLGRGCSVEFDMLFRRLSFVFYLLLLGAASMLDFRARSGHDQDAYGEFSARAVLYFPFMIAVPQLTYHYELVFLPALLPLFCRLWLRDGLQDRGARRWIVFLSLCVALSQFHAVAMEKLTGTVVWHFVPGFALFLVLLGVLLLRLVLMQSCRKGGGAIGGHMAS